MVLAGLAPGFALLSCRSNRNEFPYAIQHRQKAI